jgi:hypothetical protein
LRVCDNSVILIWNVKAVFTKNMQIIFRGLKRKIKR